MIVKIIIYIFSLLLFSPAYAQQTNHSLIVTDSVNTCYGPYKEQFNSGTVTCSNGVATINNGSGGGSTGSGTVTTGNQYQFAYYPNTTNTVNGNSNLVTDSTGNIYIPNNNLLVQIGNVGIGTISPLDKLGISVNDTTLTQILISQKNASGVAGFRLQNSSGVGFDNVSTGSSYAIPNAYGILVDSGNNLSFGSTSGTIWETIGGGNVGIGTTIPGATFAIGTTACKTGIGNDVCWGTSASGAACLGYCTAGTFPACSTCTCC